MDEDRIGGAAERRQRGVREAIVVAGSLLLVPTVALAVLSVSWSPTRVLAPPFAAPGTIFTAEGAGEDTPIALDPVGNVDGAFEVAALPIRNRLTHPALMMPPPVATPNEMIRGEDRSRNVVDPAPPDTETQHGTGAAAGGSAEPDDAGSPASGTGPTAGSEGDTGAHAASDTGANGGGRGNGETPGGVAGSGNGAENANGSDNGKQDERGRDGNSGQGQFPDDGETGNAEGKGGGQGAAGEDGTPSPGKSQRDDANTGHVDNGLTGNGKPDAREDDASARGARA